MTSVVGLPLLRLRFFLESDGPLRLSELTGAVRMRGAFGLLFRRLVCPPDWWDRDCRSCELWRICAYPTFFEPAPPADAERLRLNADLPRPYVFKPADVDSAFDVTLIGRGCEALSYMVLTVRQLGQEGFGPVRRRFRLRRVETRESAPRLVYDAGDAVVRNLAPVAGREASSTRIEPTRRTYRFLTPTILKAGGRVEEVPTYGTLVKRARDRVNALSSFFGDGPLDWDFKAMGERAECVKTLDSKGSVLRHGRFSSRKRQVHDLSGFVGEVTFEGPADVLAEFDLLLGILDEIHVGKGAALGNGRVVDVSRRVAEC